MTTTPPRRPWTTSSSRSRPSRSRSLVGSSRSTMSNRDRSSAASPTRAAWPPDSEVIRASSGRVPPRSRPSSARTAGRRSSRSAAPLAIQRSSAAEYASAGSTPPPRSDGSPSAAAATSRSRLACEHPVRRAMYSATVSPTTRSCSWGSQPTKASDGDSVTAPACGSSRPASSLRSVDFPAPLAPTTPMTSPGATVRSSESKRVRWPYPPARPWVTRVAVIRQSCHRGGTRPHAARRRVTLARPADSHVEAELHDVAVLHDVLLALHAHLALGLGLGHGAGGDEVVEGDDLGLDEAALEVGVDDAGRLRGGRALGDRPGASLLRPGGEVRLQPEGVEADPCELVQARLVLPGVGEHLGGLLGLELDELGLE